MFECTHSCGFDRLLILLRTKRSGFDQLMVILVLFVYTTVQHYVLHALYDSLGVRPRLSLMFFKHYFEISRVLCVSTVTVPGYNCSCARNSNISFFFAVGLQSRFLLVVFFANRPVNERLETLGDAWLNYYAGFVVFQASGRHTPYYLHAVGYC